MILCNLKNPGHLQAGHEAQRLQERPLSRACGDTLEKCVRNPLSGKVMEPAGDQVCDAERR
jgi:hypothetical protein